MAVAATTAAYKDPLPRDQRIGIAYISLSRGHKSSGLPANSRNTAAGMAVANAFIRPFRRERHAVDTWACSIAPVA